MDRDGTIIGDPGYLADPSEVCLLPGVGQALRRLQAAGFRLVVVSNQSGVARGVITEEDLARIQMRLETLLRGEGVTLTATYYCLHHPEGTPPYRETCNCRKPHGGLVERAAKEHGLEVSASFVVGDKLVDIELARKMGMPGVLVLTGQGRLQDTSGPTRPDFIAEDLAAAARWILEKGGR